MIKSYDWYYLIPPFLVFVVLPIIIGIFYLLHKAAEAEREETSCRESEELLDDVNLDFQSQGQYRARRDGRGTRSLDNGRWSMRVVW